LNATVKVRDLGERNLIRIISQILGGLGNEILPNEDDAVAIDLTQLMTSTMVINTDMLVSTTDIPPQMTMYQAGRKAIVMAISDVLVKGAIPRYAVIGLGVPSDLDVEGDNGFKGVIHGLHDACTTYHMKYLGGDLSETKEIIISCTVFGELSGEHIIPRSGAQNEDILLATDDFGKTGVGFALVLEDKDPGTAFWKQFDKGVKNKFMNAVLEPSTPLEYGPLFAKSGWVHASADSSDGILVTLLEICSASHKDAYLNVNQIPIALGVREFAAATKINLEKLIFSAGEEFLHIFAAPPSIVKKIHAYCTSHHLSLYAIGTLKDSTTEQPKIMLRDAKGVEKDLTDSLHGYEHFHQE
jgi:thiamine-monophosphate kinase